MKRSVLSVFLLRTLYLVLAATIILSGCRNKQADDDEDANRPPVKAIVTVRIDEVHEHDAVIAVTAYGKTDALRKEKIYSPLAGKIVALKVYEGTEVHRGDVVAVIQAKESNAAIMGAETMLRSATTPEQKEEAERTLKLARSTQNSLNVLAKFDGVVSVRSVSEGELVVENGELMTIIDLATIDFVADVPLRDLASMRNGERATIRFQSIPGREVTAVVDAVNPASDGQSQTVKVRLRFASLQPSLHSILRTEMAGTASIITGVRPRALFVPKSALLRNDENNTFTVMTMTPDSLAKSIQVSIGMMTDSTVEIRASELRKGMPVITEGNYSLADSTRVTVSRQD